MSSIQSYIKYYISAHSIENKMISIADLIGSNIEYPYFFSDMGLINGGAQSEYPVPSDLKVKWMKQLHLYQSRKQLIGTALAYKNSKGKTFPIFIFPSRFQKTGKNYRIVADFESAHINPVFIRGMKEVLGADLLALLIEHLEGMEEVGEKELMWLEAFIDKNLPEVTSQLMGSAHLLKKSTSFRGVPNTTFFCQLSIGLIARSSTTASLMSDFEKLENGIAFSRPLKRLFKDRSLRASNRTLRLFNGLPLSKAQSDICANAIQEYLNIVIGPPGTGKSYTMSALAIQLVNNGYSVLISSKTNQAVDIVHNMLKDEWGAKHYSLRPGLGKYRRQFKEELGRIGRNVRSIESSNAISDALQEASKDLERFNSEIQNQIEEELNISRYLRGENPNVIMDLWARYKLYRKEKSSTTIAGMQDQLEYFKKVLLKLELEDLESRQLSLIKSSYSKVTKLTASFLESISSRSINWRKQIQADFDYKEFFKFYPIWLCKSNEVGHYFSQNGEMFDFVLIDESSQMDIGSSLPLLQRAKHVICFGDHKQLRHVSFLSKKKEEELALLNFRKTPDDLISYSGNSLLDMVEDRLSNKEKIHLLDEHYRSLPSLIQFSNHFYYSRCLKIMKSLSESKMAIKFHRLDGIRNKKGVNEAEAIYIFQLIKERIQLDEHCSIGIISPFRSQVDFITEMCLSTFSLEEIESAGIRIDTPYGFQGDERDTVYISLALDNESKHQSIHYLRSPGLWNVCITRAKQQQHLIYSFNEDSFPNNHIVRNYIEFQHQISLSESNYSDQFVAEFTAFLRTLDIADVSINRDLGALQLDVSFYHRDCIYVVDLVGYPGQQEGGLSPEDQALLHRMKIRLMVVLYSDWIRRPNKVKSDIRQVLDSSELLE